MLGLDALGVRGVGRFWRIGDACFFFNVRPGVLLRYDRYDFFSVVPSSFSSTSRRRCSVSVYPELCSFVQLKPWKKKKKAQRGPTKGTAGQFPRSLVPRI